MMLFYDNHATAQSLNQWEKVEELIPAAARLESIMRPSPTSLTGRMTMTISASDGSIFISKREVAISTKLGPTVQQQ